MPEDGPMISSKSREILSKVRHLVPPMLEKFHKGQLGRVAVIGGSQDYTGAPFFSAMASARLGADMSHVICEPDAAQVIKTYSPNLMVHPLMRQSNKQYDSATTYSSPEEAAKEIINTVLSRLHAIVIGPGLGRDKSMQETSRLIVAEARRTGLPFVLDADGLMLVNNDPDLVRGCQTCVLTPNVVEFGRLAKALDIKLQGEGEGGASGGGGSTGDCERVSQALGGVLIVQKGSVDYISNGAHTLVSDLTGGLKRSGGQGDTLTGATATMLAWRKVYHEGLWDTEGDLSEKESLLLAAFGGSAITRECSRLAFKKQGRSLQASDVGEQVPTAFLNLIGEKEQQQSKI